MSDAATDPLQALLALTPKAFEHVVAAYITSLGFTNVQVVGGARDRGVEIRCRDEDERLVVVQCKRYKPETKITSREIQAFCGMVIRTRAARGLFVTTSSFTTRAIAVARECDIELMSGGSITEYYRETEHELRRQAELRRQRDEQGRQEQPLRAEAESVAAREAERLRRAQDLQRQQELDDARRLGFKSVLFLVLFLLPIFGFFVMLFITLILRQSP